MKMVSIVVPVYNVSLYLDELIKSLLEQTYKNLELIFVDDGSTDNSAEIIKNYAKNNERINYIYQQNHGAGVARNTGISVAKGEYLMCLDADDIYELNMIELLYKQAEKTNADITICAFKSLNFQTNAIIRNMGINFKRLPDKEVFSKDDVRDIFEITNPAPYNKLYKTEFVKKYNLKYSATKRINDLSFGKIALVFADRITTVQKELVTYRYLSPVSGSLTREKYAHHCFIAFDEIYEKIKNHQDFENLKHGYEKLVIASVYYESSFPVGEVYTNALKEFLKKEPFSSYNKKEIKKLFNVKKIQKRFVKYTIYCILTLGLSKALKCERNDFKNILKNYKSAGIF